MTSVDAYHGRHAADDDATPPPEHVVTQEEQWAVTQPALAPHPALYRYEAGFVPMKPPKRDRGRIWKTLGAVVLVAAVAAGGWLVHKATENKPDTATQTPAAHDTTVLFTSRPGRFRVRFAEHPRTRTKKSTFNGHKAAVYIAADPTGHQAVAGVSMRPGLKPSRVRMYLRGMLMGLAHGAQLTDVAKRRFRGHPAISAAFTSGGKSVVALAFSRSRQRFYLLTAADRESLAVLQNRFTTLR